MDLGIARLKAASKRPGAPVKACVRGVVDCLHDLRQSNAIPRWGHSGEATYIQQRGT